MSDESENSDSPDTVEVGREEFRANHKEFFDRVQRTSEILHVTYRGKRVNAVISASEAELLATFKGPAPMPRPGDVKAAALLLTGALEGNESVIDGFSEMNPSGNNLAGGIATLLGVLYYPIAAQDLGGRFMIVKKRGKRTPSLATITDLVMSQLTSETSEVYALPFIAGGMWALQTGDENEPAQWRNSLGVPLLPGEIKLWFSVLYRVAGIVRDGLAAELGPDHVLNVISDAGEHFGNMPRES
ncbi:hypothetical protein [Streptomyces sp. NPDC088350]|uniref:hypothetical protein n=1 Tax=Streptomyces sp. NPDC088350 TaxID=3365854 RepID=UPI00381FB693